MTPAAEASSPGAIQRAVNIAAAGDIINIEPGTYAGPVDITQNLALAGAGASAVTISGGGPVISVAAGVTASVDGVTVTGGSASGGGGVDNAGSLTISNSTIAHNSASGTGGGIENEAGGTLIVYDSTIAGNSAAANGGGIDNAGMLTIANSTIAGNLAAAGGGISDEGSLTAVNTTIAYNSTSGGFDSGGGLEVAGAGTATLYNTIVALDTDASGGDDVGGTEIVSTSSNNLVGVDDSGTVAGSVSPILVGAGNPGLDSGLADNGGPTQTVAIVSLTSPALDAGSDSWAAAYGLPTDQRGALRGPAGLNAGASVDIGAYEASSSYLVTTAADSDDAGTLRTATGWANLSNNANPANLADPAPNTIEFDTTGAFASPQTITLVPSLGALELSSISTPEVIDGPGAGVVTISGGGAVGVFQVESGVTATLAGVTISGGSSTYGGGISNGGTLTVSGSTITGNSATYGGGIDNGGTLAVSDSAIASNTSTYQGAGIYNFNYGLLTVTNSTIANNSTGEFGSGGGIFNNNFAGTVTVNSSTISDNSTGDYGYGGGIDNGGALTIINSTIANNTAGYDAGGGGISNAGTLTAVNTTITYNECSYFEFGGGVYDSSGAATTLDNTIVDVNTGYQGLPDDINGAPASVAGQNDLVGVDNTGSLTNGTNGNLVIGATNPGLGLLAYNGGPTQTIALLAGSPAIDAGSNALANDYSLTTDQRGAGYPRIVNGVVDIGAYERPAAASMGTATVYTVNSTGSGSSGTGTSGTLPYVIGQADLNPNLAGSVIQFAPTVFSASNPQTITLTSTLELGGPSGPLVIDGPGAGAVTISGGGSVEVFLAEPGAVTTLSGLTISGGSSQGNGGGIAVDYDSTLTITNSTIEGNSAASGGYVGGGIYNNGNLTVSDTMISGNSAGQGGGIFSDNLGTLTVTGGSTIEGNTGGGIINNGST